jgi:FkbM family methyltransferase
MYLNTNLLFEGILTLLKPDLILDIGSRDGREALRFKTLCPESTVIAYEANPHQFRKMASDPNVAGLVTLRNAAVTSSTGKATFFIAKADYNGKEDAANNLGQSSLLSEGIDAQEAVEVQTTTVADELDQLNAGEDPNCALWIDVEGAEAEVFKGLEKCRAKIAVIHVECATRPRWKEQKSMGALGDILGDSFVNLGHNSTFWRGWGDAVFIRKELMHANCREISMLCRTAKHVWLDYIVRRLFFRISLRS